MLTDHHREARRTAIVRLLRHSPVRRQQELVRLLKREGHAVTQSSISRDLREYTLRAYRVDDRGERNNPVPAWAWRYQPSDSEFDNDGWWQL